MLGNRLESAEQCPFICCYETKVLFVWIMENKGQTVTLIIINQTNSSLCYDDLPKILSDSLCFAIYRKHFVCLTSQTPEGCWSFEMLSNELCGKNQLEKAIMRQHEQRTHKGGRVHPWNLTWKPKMEVLKMAFLFNWVMFRFHINFSRFYPNHQ